MLRLFHLFVLVSCLGLFAAHGEARPGECRGEGKISKGTITQLGEASVTVAHWVDTEICAHDYAIGTISSEADIAVLSTGDVGACRNVEPGEGLIYEGFPAGPDAASIERDEGEIVATGFSFEVRPGHMVNGLDVGTSSIVRVGYSGGPVYSAKDGRIVGIIVGQNGKHTAFTPIETVCRIINEAKR